MNPLQEKIITGTTGELLVQLRLFQYGVQASPPLVDSGNDLIAVRGDVFKAIQVKTTAVKGGIDVPEDRLYHILAYVRLQGEGTELYLDQCEIYLIPKEIVEGNNFDKNNINEYRITQEHVNALFE